MAGGKPSSRMRTPFGRRVRAAREALGLSQAQVAAYLGITQSSYAHWERDPVALRPEQVEQLARILKVSTDTLFGTAAVTRRRQGPVGKVQQVFAAVSQLPRRQQEKILEVVAALLAQQTSGPSRVA